MASYKSQFNPPRRSDNQTPNAHRTPSTRLPQRSVTPTYTISQPAVPSKLQKKRTARDEQLAPGRSTSTQRVPAPKPSVTDNSRLATPSPSTSILNGSSSTSLSRATQYPASSRLHRLDVVGTTRTPSLVSGSSASTIDSPRSNLLRRKPSNIGVGGPKQATRTRDGSMSSQEDSQALRNIPGGYKDPFSETVLGISLPSSSALIAHSAVGLESPESYDGYEYAEQLASDGLPLPAPQYALSATPSTRYSESPGPFSVTSTPTSMSSYSPGVSLGTKPTLRARQASPMQSRPPVTRLKLEDPTLREQRGLSSVRESSTSSSSASTVIADIGRPKEKHTMPRLPVPPPTPPAQTSSTHFTTTDSEADLLQSESFMSSHRSALRTRSPKIQAPPELAHLADQPLPQKGIRRPSRPSRDGASEIVGLREPSPIIQSNMASFPSSHKRTTSADSKSGLSLGSRSRFGIHSKPPSRGPSPNPSISPGFPQPSRVPSRGPTPDVQSDMERTRARTLPTPAPSPSKTSRFGFFTRRTKTEPSSTATSKPEKKLKRKGPMAGTGHEGYGKYSIRGRSGSSTTSGGSVDRSTSAGTTTESLNRTPSSRKSSVTSATSTEPDEYFLERLNPVVIRGTGSSTELSRSPEPIGSGSSLDLARSTEGSTKEPSVSRKDAPIVGRPVLLPSAMSDPVRMGSPVKRPSVGSRRPSESDDDGKRSFLPSIASRRTSRRSSNADGTGLTRLPTPISTAAKTSSRVPASAGGTVSRKEPKASSRVDVGEGKEGNRLKSKKASTSTAAPAKPSKRWNFFQRAHAAPKVESPIVEASPTVARPPPSRSVAHYALMDQPDAIDLEDIEQIMQEADSSPEDASLSDPVVGPKVQPVAAKTERVQTMLLPPPPIFSSSYTPSSRSASPKVLLRAELPIDDVSPMEKDVEIFSSPLRPVSPMDTTVPDFPSSVPSQALSASEAVPLPLASSTPASPPSIAPPKPSRLPQVGRIPLVVSSRNKDRRPPSQSFSRPFAPELPRPNVQSRASVDSANSLTATAGAAEPFPILHGLNALTHGSAIATISPSADESQRLSEFFKFPPRKDSEVSYSSSSGIWSFPATCGTAVIPEPGAPQSEDEIWNEYDDLIDEVLSPSQPPKKRRDTTSSSNAKRQPPPLPLKPKASHTYSLSAGSSTGAAHPSLHLRRSRLLAVLQSSQTPTSPLSMTEFFSGYGERNLSVIDPVTGRLSLPSSARMSTGSAPQNRPGSTRSSLPVSISLSARPSKATLASSSDKDRDSASAARYRDSRLMEIAETQTDGLVSMANLRFGALMTSKWLSFGRVLFSPAHYELKDPAEDRVLVIDGLGKDWSYYCALTYPEATIFNLGPGPSTAVTPSGDAAEPWSTLRNHRHISHESLSHPFPFPRGFFACAVLRFPPALPSSVHRNLLSECKRVLRPGGHLEMSVLDLDLVNMGNRARRAIRGLKVKMQVAEENVSLRNISDEVMAGLGRRGFTSCYRCFVGVPVAGKLPSPDDKQGSTKRKNSTTSTRNSKQKAPKQELSFSDLLNMSSGPSEAVDSGIAEMVAKVGRWWYSRCYESVVLPEAGEPGAADAVSLLESSIWRDEALIRECEGRGTSFRLLVGYAQKPEVGMRRTVSV